MSRKVITLDTENLFKKMIILCLTSSLSIFLLSCTINYSNADTKASRIECSSSTKDASITLNEIDQLKSASLNDISSIIVDSTSTNISIQTHNKKEFEAHLYGKSVSKIEFELKRVGNTLNIYINTPDPITGEMFKATILNGIPLYDLKLDFLIPDEYKNDISISSGTGSIDIASSLKLKNITLNSETGDIVSLKSIDSQGFEVKNSTGAISLENVNCKNGSVKLTTGLIKCKNMFSKDYINFEASSGNMNLDSINCKAMLIDSSSGDVTFVNPKGDVSIKSLCGNTDLTYSHYASNKITINSITGNVCLKLPDNSSFKLDTKTSTGDIKCNFQLKSISSNDKLSLCGTVGNGKSPIVLSTSSGNISILKINH